jgi:hypothetical protein
MNALAWIFPCAMGIGLSALFFFEWRAARAGNRELERAHVAQLETLARGIRREGQQSLIELRALRAAIERSAAERRASEAAAFAAPEAAPAGDAAAIAADAPLEAEIEELPPLPLDLDPQLALEDLDPQQFIAQHAAGAAASADFSRLDRLLAEHEVTAARSQIAAIDSRLNIEVTRGYELLRQGGKGVFVPDGELPDVTDPRICAGETVDGGTLLYYFAPDEFPQIYEMKEEQRTIAELAIRRLLKMANAQEGDLSQG